MPYTLTLTNSTTLVAIPDGTVDQTNTSLTLIGKNYAGYGQFINENYVWRLENFSSGTEPTISRVLEGQLWWDSAHKILKVRDGSNWKSISSSSASGTQPVTAITGDLWWDTTTNQLKIYDNSWITIGPSYTATQGKSGAFADVVFESNGTPHTVEEFYISDVLVAIVSKDLDFRVANLPGFDWIHSGFNLISAIGNLTFGFWPQVAINDYHYDMFNYDIPNYDGPIITTPAPTTTTTTLAPTTTTLAPTTTTTASTAPPQAAGHSWTTTNVSPGSNLGAYDIQASTTNIRHLFAPVDHYSWGIIQNSLPNSPVVEYNLTTSSSYNWGNTDVNGNFLFGPGISGSDAPPGAVMYDKSYTVGGNTVLTWKIMGNSNEMGHHGDIYDAGGQITGQIDYSPGATANLVVDGKISLSGAFHVYWQDGYATSYFAANYGITQSPSISGVGTTDGNFYYAGTTPGTATLTWTWGDCTAVLHVVVA